jgi:predicted RNA-binding protein with RPS1 domain
MTDGPETPVQESAEPPNDTASAPRRIAIGTQRAGVARPKAGTQYRYVAPPVLASAAVLPGDGVIPGDGVLPGDGVIPGEPETGTPSESAAAAPAVAPAAEPAPQRPGSNVSRPPSRTAARKPAAGPPPSTRVAVPSLRSLDEDLEADYEAALAGLEVENLLTAETAGKLGASLDPGARITGRVISVGSDTAFIDLGGQRQGALKLAGLVEAGDDIPGVGDTIEVTVGGRSDEDNLYEVAPANRAVAVEDWSQLEAGMIVAARVTAANKGGLECDVAGLRGFMPASLVSTWRIENLEELVGQTLESLVTELVPEARRLVLSRRAVIEKQAADARVKLLETLEPGTELEGTVRSVRDFGAFVDIGSGVEGLVHVSELSWERVANPADVLQPGQKVRVIVKKIDPQTGKIGLSARDLVESPWKRAADKYHVGATVRGTVSRIAQFGAFVRLEPGVEGLVHVSEVASRRIRSVADVLREGQPVECRVLAVDPDAQRLSLSIKAAQPAPEMASDEEPAAADGEPVGNELPPLPKNKRSTPLKGGLGGSSDGERFGLRW